MPFCGRIVSPQCGTVGGKPQGETNERTAPRDLVHLKFQCLSPRTHSPPSRPGGPEIDQQRRAMCIEHHVALCAGNRCLGPFGGFRLSLPHLNLMWKDGGGTGFRSKCASGSGEFSCSASSPVGVGSPKHSVAKHHGSEGAMCPSTATDTDDDATGLIFAVILGWLSTACSRLRFPRLDHILCAVQRSATMRLGWA
jgi:hypothetical protein